MINDDRHGAIKNTVNAKFVPRRRWGAIHLLFRQDVQPVCFGLEMKIERLLPLIPWLVVALGGNLRADVVTSWNSAALDAIRLSRTAPPRASRDLAILHVAIYEAVNGIARTHTSYSVRSTGPASASREAAASAAAHRVLTALYTNRAMATHFDQVFAETLLTLRDSPQVRAGVAWGRATADQILMARANDGSDSVIAAPVGTGPGQWQPTPPAFAPYLFPQWGLVTPFALKNGAQLRSAGPPALTSSTWAEEFNEVKALGAAVGSVRTPEQSTIALFWADGAGTETPPGHWNHIAQDVSAARGNSLEENARLFALLNIAMADAAICAWDAKLAFNFWRPITAIRNADLDGNPDTTADLNWSSFIPTPPFPDFVSGHSTFSGAAASILAFFYGTDEVGFTTRSDALPGMVRSFASFSEAADEAALSRLYGGIHYRSANDSGLAAGLAIGEWTFTRFLTPKGNRSRK